MEYSKKIEFTKPIIVDIDLINKLNELLNNKDYFVVFNVITELGDKIEFSDITDFEYITNEKGNKITLINLKLKKNNYYAGSLDFTEELKIFELGRKFITVKGNVYSDDDIEGNHLREDIYNLLNKFVAKNEWFYYRSPSDFTLAAYLIYIFLFIGIKQTGKQFSIMISHLFSNSLLLIITIAVTYLMLKFIMIYIKYYNRLFPIVLFDIKDEENLKIRNENIKSNIFWVIIVGLIIGIIGGIVTSSLLGG